MKRARGGESEGKKGGRVRGMEKKGEAGRGYMHPHTQCTRKSKHIGSFLAFPLLLLLLPVQPHPPPPAFGFYLSCVQAQSSGKRAKGNKPASA